MKYSNEWPGYEDDTALNGPLAFVVVMVLWAVVVVVDSVVVMWNKLKNEKN